MHPAFAVVSPLDTPATKEDAIAWLEDIRDFQGEATGFAARPRIIDAAAYGWELQSGAGDIVLWATEDGLPLEMKMGPSTPNAARLPFRLRPAARRAELQHRNSGRL